MAFNEEEVSIRLWEAEQAFVFTVRRGGEGVESGIVPLSGPLPVAVAVPPADDAEALLDAAYYGGSSVMD